MNTYLETEGTKIYEIINKANEQNKAFQEKKNKETGKLYQAQALIP